MMVASPAASGDGAAGRRRSACACRSPAPGSQAGPCSLPQPATPQPWGEGAAMSSRGRCPSPATSAGSATSHYSAPPPSHHTPAGAWSPPRAQRAAPAAPAGIQLLPQELLCGIVQQVLQDDAACQRRPVVQFAGRAWLAAYRAAAYARVKLDVGAALRAQQLRGGGDEAAAAVALLAGLAVRLPYASEVSLRGLAAPLASSSAAWRLRWHLGELLLAALSGSARLRRLGLDFLPHHTPALLAARAAAGLPPLLSLALWAVPTDDILRHLALLEQQPLQALGVADAACLDEAGAAALAAALPGLPQLASLSLGGAPSPGRCCPWLASQSGGCFAAGCCCAGGGAALAAAAPPAAAAGTCLPHLQLVAAAAALPALQQLELSLTFGRAESPPQADYLQRLGCVLHAQRQRRAAEASRVSVTVHENVQGDLSAVPVASCSLNLDWDSDSNPIEVWQCSTLHELRISAQLPLQAGQFRPARLAALRQLEVLGCCHIPAYFAAALCSMQQLSRLVLSDCQPEAVAGLPWQEVLPRLPALRELSVERCAGTATLPTLWMGLAGAPALRRLRITGRSAGGGLPLPRAPAAHPAQQWGTVWQQQPRPEAPAPAPPPATIPDSVALLHRLAELDLSHNGLEGLPDSLAWCQQLTSLRLGGNRLRAVPAGVAALGGLYSLDLSSNQLDALPPGPYLISLEELWLGGNLLLQPAGLPDGLLLRRRLRRLSLPLWWRLAGGGVAAAEAALQAYLPWMLVEHS